MNTSNSVTNFYLDYAVPVGVFPNLCLKLYFHLGVLAFLPSFCTIYWLHI